MWIFLNDSFLSIVAHRHEPDMLLVRARREGDIEAVFPGAFVEINDNADYRYRTVIPRPEVASVLADCVQKVNYDNFKNSIRDHDRHDNYFDVWGTMNNFQQTEAGQSGK